MSIRKKKNSEFDAIIREKMSDLQAEYQPASWNLLHQKLNQTQDTAAVSDDSVDKAIHDKLQNIRPNYRSDYWQQLADRLSLQQNRVHAIFRAKTAELIAILLLIWTITQWGPSTTLPYEPDVDSLQASPAVAENPSTSAESSQIVSDQLPKKSQPDRRISRSQIKQVSGQKPVLKVIHSDDQLAAGSFLSPQLPELHTSEENQSGSDEATAPSAVISQPLQIAAPLLAHDEGISDVHSLARPISIVEELYKPLPIVSYEYQPSQPLASVNNGGLTLAYKDPGLPNLYDIKPFQKRKALRVGMMGAPDYNRIITPPQIVNGERSTEVSIERYALGYSGGITLGFDANRWEIETGMIYSAQRYTPLQVLFVEGSVKTGFYAEQLKHFEFNSVYFPVNLRYNFLLRDKWRIYGMAGGAWHLTVQANYYIDFQPNARLMAAPVAPESPYSSPSGVDNQNLVKGWLEGGSLQDNSYFSLNGSVGIERYMTTRWSIFAQPTYQHWFFHTSEGLGPFKDKIHSFSILTGVKIRL